MTEMNCRDRVLFQRTVWDSQACHKRMKGHDKVMTCFPKSNSTTLGRRDYDITEIDITESDVAEFDITENDITESDITETNITRIGKLL